MALDDFINVGLLSHPYNWIIVVLILALSVFALCLLAAPLGQIGGLTQVV
jgi:hypothetical protein